MNGNELGKSTEAAYAWNQENRLSQATVVNDTIVAHTYDVDGNRVKTVVTPQNGSAITCSGNTATFAKTDTTTLGNWQGPYGADGQYINGETAAPPSYGALTTSATSGTTYVASTTDLRALEQPPPQPSRIASTYFSNTTGTFHVTTNDHKAHTIALYMIDWDVQNRTQTVTAQTTTGTVLDSARTFSAMTNGIWVVYTICGNVDFAVTRVVGPNSVVSGVFFGTPEPG